MALSLVGIILFVLNDYSFSFNGILFCLLDVGLGVALRLMQRRPSCSPEPRPLVFLPVDPLFACPLFLVTPHSLISPLSPEQDAGDPTSRYLARGDAGH